ncbi:MAG TPA: HlyD family secretion protein [Vicinamibacterales bacterium]|nr:HlyD family secretion protein [Vicinamibacterales bacterium]
MTDRLVALAGHRNARVAAGLALIAIVGMSAWLWATAGYESTDDAQVDGHVAQIAARVGGTVRLVVVNDNQRVEAGAVLVDIDPRDFQVAVDKARAELADAEASALAARTNVPITSTTTTSTVSTAQGAVDQALSGVAGAEKEIEAARARLVTAQAKQREAEANATKTARDVERLRGLLAKDEVSQQQFDAAVAAADAARASSDSARSQVAEAEHGIPIAESRLLQAQATGQRARAELRSAGTGPEQVAAVRARAQSADARVQQARAVLEQSELNLQYTTVRAPIKGVVSRKSVELGQVIQAGQPLMTVIPLDDVWITANFKETQLTNMRPGQRARVVVDAYGGRAYTGRVDSVAAATGARFSLLPPENATGNFVKVVQRVPVKLILDPGQDPEQLLRPGLSVTPTVYFK